MVSKSTIRLNRPTGLPEAFLTSKKQRIFGALSKLYHRNHTCGISLLRRWKAQGHLKVTVRRCQTPPPELREVSTSGASAPLVLTSLDFYRWVGGAKDF